MTRTAASRAAALSFLLLTVILVGLLEGCVASVPLDGLSSAEGVEADPETAAQLVVTEASGPDGIRCVEDKRPSIQRICRPRGVPAACCRGGSTCGSVADCVDSGRIAFACDDSADCRDPGLACCHLPGKGGACRLLEECAAGELLCDPAAPSCPDGKQCVVSVAADTKWFGLCK